MQLECGTCMQAQAVELLCRCDDIPDDGIELRVLKGLLTAVTSNAVHVHGQALLLVTFLHLGALTRLHELYHTFAKWRHVCLHSHPTVSISMCTLDHPCMPQMGKSAGRRPNVHRPAVIADRVAAQPACNCSCNNELAFSQPKLGTCCAVEKA